MPGIVGLVGAEDLGRVSAALKKISYIEAYEASVFPESPTLTLGCVGRPSQRDFATSPDPDQSRLSVLVYGTVFSQHPRPRRLPASQILDDYRTGGFRELRQNYDGSFVIVVVDHGKARVHVATDRVGTQPVYYREVQGVLAFGPEVKALMTASDTDARLSEAGILNLLVTGYNPGRLTLFDSV